MTSPKSIAIAFSRKSVLLILTVITLASVLAVWLVVDIASIQDRKSYVQTSHFIRVSTEEKQKWLHKMVVDYADWGTAYAHLHLTIDTVWAYDQNNVGRTLVEDLGIEYGAVFDSTGKEVYSVVFGDLRTDEPVSKLAGGVKEIVARAAAMDRAGHQVASGIVMANGEPVLIVASILSVGDDTSVTPDNRPPSILLFGDQLTRAELAQIRDSLHLSKMQFTQADIAKTAADDIFLRTTDGSIGFVLDVAAPQPGRDMLHAVVPWFAMVFASLIIFVVFLARHGLRIAAMSKNAAMTLAESHRLLEQQALHDPVTGLPNRIMLARRIADIPDERTRATVLFLDLDRFKPVNDTYGHEAGDFVLREVGRRLQASTRGDDLCVRLGGDEFVILVTNQDDAALHRLCRRIIQNVSSGIDYRDASLSVGVSIGVADVTPGPDAVEDVLRSADRALYDAKTAGRSRYCWFAKPSAPKESSAA
jgi:diguanylate cyclase (GGDEF)-like protein